MPRFRPADVRPQLPVRGRALAVSPLDAGGFQGYSLMVRSLRLAVRTSPSQGENRSSILLGSASCFRSAENSRTSRKYRLRLLSGGSGRSQLLMRALMGVIDVRSFWVPFATRVLE